MLLIGSLLSETDFPTCYSSFRSVENDREITFLDADKLKISPWTHVGQGKNSARPAFIRMEMEIVAFYPPEFSPTSERP